MDSSEINVEERECGCHVSSEVNVKEKECGHVQQ